MPIFKLRHWDIHPAHLWVCVHHFGSIWGCPNAPKQNEKKTFSGCSGPFPGLFIRLGAYFQASTLEHTSHPLVGLWAPFWVHFWVPRCPKTAQKTYFLVAPDHLFLKNRLNDMVSSLFSSLNIGTYMLPTCGPLCTFLGPFGGGQIPQYSTKKLYSGRFVLFLLQERA
jgi:hypothetical protein